MEMEATSSSTSKPIASEVVVSSIQDTEVSVMKKEIELLKAKNNLQDEEIRELKAKQKHINDHLRAQERYTRKDSLIIVNPPFDARQVCNVTHETLKFFEKFLGVEITEDSIKACHIIPNSGNEFQLPTVICNFIYFADKQSVYEKRKRLRKTKNRINNKAIYLNEPLPEYEAQIKNEANKRNMITATHNCAVSVLVENGREKAKFVKINEIEDLDSINAIKRKKNISEYLLLTTLSTHLHTNDLIFKTNRTNDISQTQ